MPVAGKTPRRSLSEHRTRSLGVACCTLRHARIEVNSRIRVRDQEVTAGAADAAAIMRHEAEPDTHSMLGLKWDVSKAHRRIPVAEEDWRLQACSLKTDGGAPQMDDTIWCNTAGTYGVASAGAWWVGWAP